VLGPAAHRRRIIIVLAAIVLIGGGLRANAAADPDPTLSADEAAYVREAFNLPHYGDFHWPPGAPAMFAASRVFANEKGLPAAYWFQALVGTLLIATCFAIAAVAAGPIAGLLAAALVAFYPPFVTLTGSLQSEPLGTLMLALAMLAVVWALTRDGRLRWWALAGVFFGLTVLTRTDLILAPGVVAVIAAIALWRRSGARSALVPMAVLLAAYVICLTPWTAFASHHTGHFTPVTEGDAPALYVGTFLPGDGTTGGMKTYYADKVRALHPGLRDVSDYSIPAAVYLKYVASKRPSLSRDDALRAEAKANLRRYALGRPFDFAQMMAAKVQRTWFLSSRAGSPTKSDITRAYHVVLVLACLLLMLVVVVMRRSAFVAMCLALIAYSMLLHAVFVAKPRYALPLIPLLIAGGVVAGFVLFERWQASRGARSAVA
jgi:4-amino-4-deoxy-L-arabinose transferase-like glycosyltransferase